MLESTYKVQYLSEILEFLIKKYRQGMNFSKTTLASISLTWHP